MTTLSSQPYKGTRDYYPEDKRVQNYIFSTWRQVVERYGYQEYGAPLLEPLEVYTAKSGQELADEQTYSFTDRGDRTVAIRPEMTPSVSRMVAARRQELGYPARLYSIANFMRYERPQRGREREFWQLNADVFGVEGVLADAEVIELANEIMTTFGATSDMYTIRINNRKLIKAMMSDYLGLGEEDALKMTKLFDRKAKISQEDFDTQAAAIFGDATADGLQRVQQVVSIDTIDNLPQALRDTEGAVELAVLFSYLQAAGIKGVRFDATLMRGLDYYTGMVFEVFDLHPDNNRSMFGGGRYDGLVGMFGADPVPTVGFAPGLTTTELFLRTHSLLPQLQTATEVGVVVVDDSTLGALSVARQLRSEGVNVDVDISGRKLDKQLKGMLKKQVPFLVFVGADEIVSEVYPFKDISSASEEKLSLERIVAKVKDYRRRLSAQDDDLFI